MGITSRDDKAVGWEVERLGSDLQNNDPEGRTLLKRHVQFLVLATWIGSEHPQTVRLSLEFRH